MSARDRISAARTMGSARTARKAAAVRLNGAKGGAIAWYEADGARLVTTRRNWSVVVSMSIPAHIHIRAANGETFFEADCPTAGDACAMAEVLLRRNT